MSISCIDSAVLSVCTSGAGDERPLSLGVDEAAARTVGPVLVLAQVHVDPRDEAAAQNGVDGLEGHVVGVRARRRQLDRHDQRLLGAGAVDEEDARLGLRRDGGELLGGQRLAGGLPRGQPLLQQRARSAASVVSPTISNVALSGRTQRR